MSVEFTDFPAGHALAKKPSHVLDFRTAELVWGAISVGKGHLAHMKAHGDFSRLERRYRSYMLQAHLKVSASGAVHRSSLYDGLDPSEKSAVSYFVGMAVTKMLFWRYFKVRWLMHLDVFRSRFSVRIKSGERPDLFGRDDVGNWYVVESKGRTGGRSTAALSKAKNQASMVTGIAGVKPHLSAGVMSYYTKNGLCCEVVDPDPNEERGFSIGVETARFFAEYYRPLIDMVDTAPVAQRGERVRRGVRYKTMNLDDAGIVIGYDPRLRQLLHPSQQQGDWLPAVWDAPIGDAAEANDDLKFLGPDGMLVELDDSWSQKSLQKEPQSRGA